MRRVVFSNRQRFVVFIFIAILLVMAAVIVGLLVTAGEANRPTLLFMLGVLALVGVVLAVIISFMSRRYIAELTVTETGLEVELLRLFGTGQRFEAPLPPAEDWRFAQTQAQTGQRGGFVAVNGVGVGRRRVGRGLSGRHAHVPATPRPLFKVTIEGVEYTMPLDGARVVDLDWFAGVAPVMVAAMQAVHPHVRNRPAPAAAPA